MSTTVAGETVLDALVRALRSAQAYNKNDQEPPAALLWPDKERQWEPLIPRLRSALPALLTYGPYDPEARTGPAIWLRCMIARALPEADWPEEAVPILYLPGVGKADLRAIESCPRELQPLAELQYRGALWTQTNGKDWTVRAFVMTANGGLDIDVAGDIPTQDALRNALVKLADVPVAELQRNAPIRAGYLHDLLNPDRIRALLEWLDNPKPVRAGMDDAQWTAFRATCRGEYGLDPVTDGEVSAAAKLGAREGNWQTVWWRFADAPARYPHLPNLLRRARPSHTLPLLDHSDAWPQVNEEREAALRQALTDLRPEEPTEARNAVAQLEHDHGARRGWVWAHLGMSPLAAALEPLARLAALTGSKLVGGTVAQMVTAYTDTGWQVDAAAIDALAAVSDLADAAAVKNAVRALYHDWLRDAADAFQGAVRAAPTAYISSPATAATPDPGCCILFADGLRFDVGQRLAAALAAKGYQAATTPHLAALPTVTPTAKPAVTPVADAFGTGTGFDPRIAATGQKSDITVLRKVLADRGFEVLLGDDIGDASGAAWTEFGELDSYGHGQGWKLAKRVVEQVGELADRIATLLDAGWREVRVVTDHGWLLMPGGLPKTELPEHLTEPRKGRCARLKPGASTSQQTVPWHWDASVAVAVAPGISCYDAGKEYEHGGLSPQECITPVIVAARQGADGPAVTIEAVEWRGLRCRVKLGGTTTGFRVDIRTKAADATSTIGNGIKTVGGDGTTSLAVPDDEHEGIPAVVVVLDAQGSVLKQAATIVGGEG